MRCSKRVVAEGVETERQAAILARLGCDHIQGYYYSRPLPAAMLAEFVAQAAAGAAGRPPNLAQGRRAAMTAPGPEKRPAGRLVPRAGLEPAWRG